MAGTLSQIRRGLAQQIALVPGLRVSEQLPEQINPPVAIITRASVDYQKAMAGGLTEWGMEVRLISGRMAEQSAQRQIDAWLSWDGEQSLRRAIEADPTLGGAAETCVVTRCDALSSMQIGDADYLTVTLFLTVWA